MFKPHGGAHVSAGQYPSFFSDGGGFLVINGRIKVIPPWSPETRAIVQAASHMLGAAAVVKDEAIKADLEGLAQRLMVFHGGQLQQEVDAAAKE